MPTPKNEFLKSFISFADENNFSLHEGTTLLAVSGGIDSMTMMHLFNQTKFLFAVGHCHFGLRKKDSDEDQELTELAARDAGVPFHTIRFETKTFSSEKKISIQEAARELRYAWLSGIASEKKYQRIATAHHSGDSVETFFINLLRGTGPDGLRGIPARNGPVIRPMLFASRDEIEKYASKNKVSYREDYSNRRDDYLRNRIRHHLVPWMEKESPALGRHLKTLMEEIAFAQECVRENLNSWKKKNTSYDKNGQMKIPLREIRSMGNAEVFLSTLLHTMGITGVDCKKVLATRSAGKMFYAKDFRLLIDREHLLIRGNVPSQEKESEIAGLPFTGEYGGKRITLKIERAGEEKRSRNRSNCMHANAGLLQYPLIIRRWKAGDAFVPQGMKGRKKVSDFFIDKKLDRFEKEQTFILLSGKNIVCILGHRIDDRFKVTADTGQVLTIETEEL